MLNYRIFLTVFILNITFNSFCDDINNYNFELIKIIPIGKEEGNIGFVKKVFGGMPHGPRVFYISEKNEIYIPDFANGRINVYNLNLNYLKTIVEKENKILHQATKLQTDNENNIIALATKLRKINQAGEIKYEIEEYKIEELKRNGFFIIGSDIFYYGKSNYINSIALNGNFRNKEESAALLNKLNEEFVIANSNFLRNTKSLSAEIKKIELLRNGNKHIIVGDMFFSGSFYETKDYYKKTKTYFEELKSIKKTATNANKKQFIIDEAALRDSHIIGYDDEHNGYWQSYSAPFVFIYSNTGDVIDAFYFDELKNKNTLNGTLIHIAASPSGDVYFMRNDETGSYFWKVLRRW